MEEPTESDDYDFIPPIQRRQANDDDEVDEVADVERATERLGRRGRTFICVSDDASSEIDIDDADHDDENIARRGRRVVADSMSIGSLNN